MIVLSCLRHRCNHNINMVFFLQNSYTFSRGCIWYMVNVLLFDHPRNKRQHLSCLLFVVFNWHFKDKNIFKRYIRLKLCKMYNLFRMHWVILEITFNWFFYCPIRIVNAPVKKKICIHCLLMSLFSVYNQYFDTKTLSTYKQWTNAFKEKTNKHNEQ